MSDKSKVLGGVKKLAVMRFFKNKIIIALVVIIGLSFINYVEQGFQGLVTEPVYNGNVKKLQDAEDRVFKTFAILTGFKVVLELVNGSDVSISPFGLGVSLKVGKIVEPILDFVDFAWYVTLVAIFAIKLTKNLLLVGHHIEYSLLIFLLISFLIFYISLMIRSQLFYKISRFFTSVALTITLIVLVFLPLTVTVGDWLSKKTTANMRETADLEINKLKKELDSMGIETVLNMDDEPVEIKEDGWFDSINPKKLYESVESKVEQVKFKANQFVKWVEVKAVILKHQLYEIMIAFVLDTVVFPLLLIIIFIYGVRLFINEVFTSEAESRFKFLNQKINDEETVNKIES